MPKCEKCGYVRATADWCTSCGSQNPYPKKLWFLRAVLAVSLILILATGTFFARWVAAERLTREKAQAGAFRAQREVRLIDMPANRR